MRCLRISDTANTPTSTSQPTTIAASGGVAHGEHVMAFAQAISQLPGVERVVVLSNTP